MYSLIKRNIGTIVIGVCLVGLAGFCIWMAVDNLTNHSFVFGGGQSGGAGVNMSW